MTDNRKTSRQYLTPQQAAARLRLSVDRVYQYCRAGRLGTWNGTRWTILAGDLARFSRIPRRVGRPSKKPAT